MKNKIILGSISLFPTMALAHGEDILEPILSQLGISLLIILYIIFSSNNLKNKAKLMLGLIIGIITSWIFISNFNYDDFLKHHILITSMVTLLPILTTFCAKKIKM